MECARAFTLFSNGSTTFRQPWQHCISKLNKSSSRFTAKLNCNDDPLLQAAIHAATLRFQETHRPEPLFLDPYVDCLVPANTPVDMKQHTQPYCLATRFIDDKLIQTLKSMDELRQVVLLTDGADTRAYRLTWPSSTLIYDISPDEIYNEASEKLKAWSAHYLYMKYDLTILSKKFIDIGAQIPRSCLLLHISPEFSNIQESLRKKGFNGNRPSIWVLQGLPLITLTSFEDVLLTVGSLAMKGSVLLGEIPAWLAKTQLNLKTTQEEWMHKLFLSHGFQVQMIDYRDVAQSLGREQSMETCNSILFVAEHLRFSDDQMEIWRREFQRAEEEGDEEGFEDL